jgi:hypothetical protein
MDDCGTLQRCCIELLETSVAVLESLSYTHNAAIPTAQVKKGVSWSTFCQVQHPVRNKPKQHLLYRDARHLLHS